MSKLIAIIKIIAQLLPTIIEAIKAIEAAVPASGQGAQKLALVRELIDQTVGEASPEEVERGVHSRSRSARKRRSLCAAARVYSTANSTITG